MTKRKLDDFKNDSEFRFWGIVISRFVWDYSRAEVAAKFGCTEPYVTQVMNKFECRKSHHSCRRKMELNEY